MDLEAIKNMSNCAYEGLSFGEKSSIFLLPSAQFRVEAKCMIFAYKFMKRESNAVIIIPPSGI